MGINLDFAPVADTLGPAGQHGDRLPVVRRRPGANARRSARPSGACRAPGWRPRSSTSRATATPAADSHDELPVVKQSLPTVAGAGPAAVRRPGIDAGAGVVMSGHLDVEALDKGVAGDVLPQDHDGCAAQAS